MIHLSVGSICIYLCIAMSSLTLTASILALYVLISLTNNKSETGQNMEQEDRQREESSRPRPLCLATQLWHYSINIAYKFLCCDIVWCHMGETIGATWHSWGQIWIFPTPPLLSYLRKLPPASAILNFHRGKPPIAVLVWQPGFAPRITVNNTRVRGILGIQC